ncbi:hypothetical protein BKA65DRAFT_499401 [Rhexocercosporidium sp. MPI-PUGE-AT-0058]|nr:hypothetical protein BKA65DRAFT_499401 [Rhexocercosporidium sp. MPI-PUGE-AT-0058]
MCIRMMLKTFAGDAESNGFQSASFLLKQNNNVSSLSGEFPTTALICLMAPLPFRRRIYAAFDTSRRGSSDYITEVVLDPFRVVSLISMSWYWWNTQLFWALEIFNSKNNTTGKAEFEYMHLVAKDMIQVIELMEFAVTGVKNVRSIYPFYRLGISDRGRLDVMDETEAALDYHLQRFEGVSFRTRALLKRMDNQISLAFNLVQQHDAKASQRSSDSVTAISFLTLIFLPGTAIAAIFATPFFKPAASGVRLEILPSIVYYWIVTVPITVLIVSLWHWWRTRAIKIAESHTTAHSASWHRSSHRTTTQMKDHFKMSTERRSSLNMSRPRSPHFWQYEPKWPMPQIKWSQSIYGV